MQTTHLNQISGDPHGRQIRGYSFLMRPERRWLSYPASSTWQQIMCFAILRSCQGWGCAGGVEDAPLHSRIAAALVTSAIGITVANPSDVVKIRQQACTIRGAGSGTLQSPSMLMDMSLLLDSLPRGQRQSRVQGPREVDVSGAEVLSSLPLPLLGGQGHQSFGWVLGWRNEMHWLGGLWEWSCVLCSGKEAAIPKRFGGISPHPGGGGIPGRPLPRILPQPHTEQRHFRH